MTVSESERTIVIRDRRKPNQYTTDNVIAREWLPILRVGDAFFFYSIYLSMANRETESSWGSLRTMAQYLQCSIDLVIRANKLLEICELIYIDSGDHRTTNEYYILDPPSLTPEMKARIHQRLDEIEAQNLGKNWQAWVRQVRKALDAHRSLPEIWAERRARKGGRPRIVKPTSRSQNPARESLSGCSCPTSRVFVSHDQGAREPQTKQEQITREREDKEEVIYQDVLNRCLAIGVSLPVAEVLLERHTLQEILQQLEWLPQRNPREPAAMLVAAVQGHWGPPGRSNGENGREGSRSHQADALSLSSKDNKQREEDLIWKQALDELRLSVPRAVFDTWLQGTCLREIRDGEAIIEVRNHYAQAWLQHRLNDPVRRCLEHVLGHSVKVSFEAKANGEDNLTA